MFSIEICVAHFDDSAKSQRSWKFELLQCCKVLMLPHARLHPQVSVSSNEIYSGQLSNLYWPNGLY